MHHNWQGADVEKDVENVEKILFFSLTSIKSVDPTFLC